eukprot:jgi/Mesen1/5562/ME000280S04680
MAPTPKPRKKTNFSAPDVQFRIAASLAGCAVVLFLLFAFREVHVARAEARRSLRHLAQLAELLEEREQAIARGFLGGSISTCGRLISDMRDANADLQECEASLLSLQASAGRLSETGTETETEMETGTEAGAGTGADSDWDSASQTGLGTGSGTGSGAGKGVGKGERSRRRAGEFEEEGGRGGESLEVEAESDDASEDDTLDYDDEDGSRDSGAAGCTANMAYLTRHMEVTWRGMCPRDWEDAEAFIFAHKCVVPPRPCFAAGIPSYSAPLALPLSLWRQPDDANVRWGSFGCKNFTCLRHVRASAPGCNRCFDFDRERRRLTQNPGQAQGGGRRGGQSTQQEQGVRGLMTIERLLELKNGSIRVGLDVAGGSGSFAARMAELRVTIATSGRNYGLPLMETVALRGLLPLYVPYRTRLPFFDNTLDLVHVGAPLGELRAPAELGVVFFEWDRVVRPGGILWLQGAHPGGPTGGSGTGGGTAGSALGEGGAVGGGGAAERFSLMVAAVRALGYREIEWRVVSRVVAAPAASARQRGGKNEHATTVAAAALSTVTLVAKKMTWKARSPSLPCRVNLSVAGTTCTRTPAGATTVARALGEGGAVGGGGAAERFSLMVAAVRALGYREIEWRVVSRVVAAPAASARQRGGKNEHATTVAAAAVDTAAGRRRRRQVLYAVLEKPIARSAAAGGGGVGGGKGGGGGSGDPVLDRRKALSGRLVAEVEVSHAVLQGQKRAMELP